MASPAVKPFIMKDVDLKVGADNYEAHVSSVEFVPTASAVTWKGLTPDSSFTFSSAATWVCNLALAQDWETEGSLSQYLYDHEGESVEVDFTPSRGGRTVTATVSVVPGSIGGAVDAVAVATVSLGVQGRPVFGSAPTATQ